MDNTQKQYLVIKMYGSISPSSEICYEEDLGKTIKNYSGGKEKIRIFEWNLNKLGLDEVEVVTQIRKVEDTFIRKEDGEVKDPDNTKYA